MWVYRVDIRNLNSIADDELRELFFGSEIVALLGAGISSWSPTNLPLGSDFSDGIFDAIFRDKSGKITDQNEKLLIEIYKLLPFETINESCPYESKITEILRNIFHVTRPNPIHELFAQMLKDNKVNSVITPNYDCSLDSAIAAQYNSEINLDIGAIRRIIFDSDTDQVDLSSIQLFFKIHGSTDDFSGKSLVFRLHQEGVLPPWKRHVFRKAIEGKVLLVVGYSGSDFDICPEIPLASPKRIIWNVRNAKIKENRPNLKEVAKKTDTTFIVADMVDFLSKVFQPVNANPSHNPLDLENIFRHNFSSHERRLWKVRILNNLTYNHSALMETKQILKEGSRGVNFDIEVLSQYGGASASFGNYKQAALAHEKAAKIANKYVSSPEEMCRQLLFASDAWRCYGGFSRSILCHLKVKKVIQKIPNPSLSMQAGISRNEVLIMRHLYDLLKRLYIKPLAQKVRSHVEGLIKSIIEIYRDSGEWYPLQQMELWNERFDLPHTVTTFSGEYEIPPSLEGYRQLNFPMGEMMAFRQKNTRGNIPITTEIVTEARRLANLAIALGINPEIWKMHLLILLKYKNERNLINDTKIFFQTFMNCEYSLFFRVWRLILRD
jgi:hypothetical protein